MGIQSAMYSGVSGLNTNSQALSVIGNNLANTNTLGFKGSRTVFSDLMSSTVYGSGGASQVGRGVGVSTVDNVFSQGTFETTSSSTDVAIEGEGFFLLREATDETTYYSRAGAFRFNEEGYLVNPEGLRVQGKQFDAAGNLVAGDPDDIRVVNTGLIEANATEEITIDTNLDSSSEIPVGGWPGAIVPADTATYNYAASTQIFDSLGEPHVVSMYWRIADPVANTWEWSYEIPDAGLQAAGAPGLTFNTDGTLPDTTGDGFSDPVTGTVAGVDWGNGSDIGNLTINFNCTQFDSDSQVIGQEQDGYAAGNLTNVGINDEGIVVANYSNGEQVSVGQLVLGKFRNPNGLLLSGANVYTASDESGNPRIGLPGPELGTIFTNSLEQSNVDMGQEFVKMITAQRGFQANSKIISMVDELLGELINLKR